MDKGERDDRRAANRGTEEHSGTVIAERVSPGSKSDRMAVVLDTGTLKLQLRRPGVRSYGDEELEGLVGKRVTCRGIRLGPRLFLQEWPVVEDDGETASSDES